MSGTNTVRTLTLLMSLVLAFCSPVLATDRSTNPLPNSVHMNDTLDYQAVIKAQSQAQLTPNTVLNSETPDEGPTGPATPRSFDLDARQANDEKEQAELFKSFINQQRRMQQTKINADKLSWDTVGGDDVTIMSHANISSTDAYDMDITNDGDIYVAVQVQHANFGDQIQVWRSLDGGTTWNYWDQRSDDDPDVRFIRPSLHVAEGAEDRLFLAYEYHNPNMNTQPVNVAYTDIDGPFANWTVYNAMYSLGDTFRRPNITSDHINWHNYRVYLVCEQDDGAHNDIWFRASDDFGVSWEPMLEIGHLDGLGDYSRPNVSYGNGGIVHVSWGIDVEATEFQNDAVRYRRAINRGANGFADWDAVKFITSLSDGYRSSYPVVTGNPHNNDALISYRHLPTGGGVMHNVVRVSNDNGATWLFANAGTAPNAVFRQILALPGLSGYRMWGSSFGSAGYGYTAATAADPQSWDDAEIMADYYHEYAGNYIIRSAAADFDISHGYQLGMIFAEVNYEGDGPDRLFFDAEWLREPGYPVMDENFPMPLVAPPVTPPALADIDADGRTAEIVFATADNMVHAIDRFGAELPGFPVYAGDAVADESLAVGDLDGDGTNEIVVGTKRGQVLCWDNTGSMMSGWPRDLDTGVSAYVSIGTVSHLSQRDVVACSGLEIHLLRFNGAEHNFAPYPIVVPDTLHSAAAIGDIDLDGREELVVTAGSRLRVYRHDTTPSVVRTMAGTDLRNSPSLGNIDEADAELEIVVPTDDGQVWVFQHVGSTMTGWPYDTGVDSPINEVALSSIGPFSNDLSFTQKNPLVYLLAADGSGVPGWPQLPPNPIWFLLGSPIVDDLGPLTGNVAIGSRSNIGTVFGTDGSIMTGWPRNLGDKVNVSPASGDVDADGKVDLVYLTDTELVVLNLNHPLSDEESGRWPMYGHDAQRTGCSDCAIDQVSGTPNQPGATLVSFAMASANPSSGPTSFRYSIPNPAAVMIDIVDLRGYRVKTIVQEEQSEGDYIVTWDGRNRSGQQVGQGMYLARLRVDGKNVHVNKVRKIILTR